MRDWAGVMTRIKVQGSNLYIQDYSGVRGGWGEGGVPEGRGRGRWGGKSWLAARERQRLNIPLYNIHTLLLKHKDERSIIHYVIFKSTLMRCDSFHKIACA